MFVLILTLVTATATATAAAPAMTTAEFSSRDTCLQAANAWKLQAKFEFGSAAKLTTVCMPK